MRPDEVRDAILNLWQEEAEKIIAFVILHGATKEQAEDAVQDAFIEAWGLPNIPGEWEKIHNPSGWIRTVAVRKCSRAYRKTSREVVSELTQPLTQDGPADPGELTVQTQLILAILRRLDADTRLVMSLHIQGYRSVEIAGIMGIDGQKARDLKKKGRKALIAELCAMGELSGWGGKKR